MAWRRALAIGEGDYRPTSADTRERNQAVPGGNAHMASAYVATLARLGRQRTASITRASRSRKDVRSGSLRQSPPTAYIGAPRVPARQRRKRDRVREQSILFILIAMRRGNEALSHPRQSVIWI